MGFLLILLCISAFASSSETALFSLDRFQLRRIREKYVPAFQRISELLTHPTRTLIVILLLNETANVAMANFFTRNLSPQIQAWLLPWIDSAKSRVILTAILSTLAATPVMLIFGEITPKVLAARFNRLIALVNSRPLHLIYKFLLPLLIVLDKIIGFFLRGIKAEKTGHLSKFVNPLDEEDFVHLVDEAQKEGTLKPAEKRLIQKVFHLDDVSCKQIMKPLAKAFLIEATSKMDEALPILQKEGYSRVPIYDGPISNITGILYLKDILIHAQKKPLKNLFAKDLATKAYLVSEKLSLNVLFRRFKKNRVHIAVVCDEHQIPVGIVTMEDLLETIFGQIADERDVPAPKKSLHRRVRRKAPKGDKNGDSK